jgi:hypothetical protein
MRSGSYPPSCSGALMSMEATSSMLNFYLALSLVPMLFIPLLLCTYVNIATLNRVACEFVAFFLRKSAASVYSRPKATPLLAAPGQLGCYCLFVLALHPPPDAVHKGQPLMPGTALSTSSKIPDR